MAPFGKGKMETVSIWGGGGAAAADLLYQLEAGGSVQ